MKGIISALRSETGIYLLLATGFHVLLVQIRG